MIADAANLLRGRESVLQLILAELIADYREQIEEVCAQECFLEAKVETLERLHCALRGVTWQPPLDLDDEAPF